MFFRHSKSTSTIIHTSNIIGLLLASLEEQLRSCFCFSTSERVTNRCVASATFYSLAPDKNCVSTIKSCLGLECIFPFFSTFFLNNNAAAVDSNANSLRVSLYAGLLSSSSNRLSSLNYCSCVRIILTENFQSLHSFTFDC